MKIKDGLREEINALDQDILKIVKEMQESHRIALMRKGGLELVKRKMGIGKGEHKSFLTRLRALVTLAVLAVLIFGLVPAGICGERGEKTSVEEEFATAAEARAGNEPGYTDKSKSVRYRQEMRNLDRLYQEGGLTRTEYIQQKREIGNIED